MSRVEVLAVASEIFPLIKTGGLADVVGALPAALAHEDVHVRTLIPGYPAVLAALDGAKPVHATANLFAGRAQLLAARAAGLDLLVLDAPHLFARFGNPYVDANGRDWPDNALRFAALARVGADIGGGLLDAWAPDVVHAHDWQAGLTPAYLRYAPASRRRSGTVMPGTVMSVHNMAFQGRFPASLLATLGLPEESFAIEGVEYYGDISYLKAGLHYADRITTVSPTYATEIRTPADGMGLDGVLRARAGVLSGILNGIDTDIWNPETDPHIAAPFSAASIDARAANKTALQTVLGLDPDAAAPLFGVVSRQSWQKGLDILLEVLPTLLAQGGQLALLGTGDAAIEAGFRAAAAANPRRIGCVIGYDEALAHRIQAGADALLVPSRFEPCGLTQLCALRYGNVPVVARVGGLADTVIDASPMALAAGAATGVQFAPVTADMLRAALQRTVALYRQPALWRQLQLNGMATDVSWRDPARRYAALFRALLH
jgi:starch synthase